MTRSADLSPTASPPGRSIGRPSALFTAERATATLPLVRRIVGDAVPLAHDLAERRARLAWVRRTPGSKRHHDGPHAEELEDVERELGRDADRLSGYVAEIRRLGAVLRDASGGLVEFPGPRVTADGEARDGFYSWRPGEDAVTHWRPAAADPADRAPLRSLAAPVGAAADLPAVDHAA
ncbi:DUF2203 domain-containing protein [Alienimonas californiensis]|uniref:DUF2203 domain-containing protein n=1 Tax=Alienimonas californiensis TaxID=2527989 RepID=A0A517PEJ0_9PLAN|nr:DUF2203 family protein [Alienimonas californiensis]QDT17786.1 hypothetical protein CA12_39190 [Alienimonas californiensis]